LEFRLARVLRRPVWQARSRGPFGFQRDNNATRIFEYAWAFHAVPVGARHTVVDVGGSLGGLQFVLSRSGAHVINVDPSEQADMGWPLNQDTFNLLNRAFGTTVELRKCFIEDAGLVEGSVDRVYCISTIEHIPEPDLRRLAITVRRVLKPGGFLVATVDLFYDLFPFTHRDANIHGRNVNVREFIDWTGLELTQGRKEEIFGYSGFDPESILSRATEFVQGDIALNTVQAFVLHKPE
jgi:SAM-dependent methyltransferase